MKKKIIYIIIFLVPIVIITFSLLIALSNMNNSILQSNEAQITAKLKVDEFVVNSGLLTIDKDIELNITVSIPKEVKGSLTIYPIINNTNRLSFNSSEESNFEYYKPSSIGGSGFLNEHVKNILENEKIEANDFDLSLIAIPISTEKGVVHLKAYMNKKNNNIEIDNPKLVILYHKEIFGFDYLWHKVLPIAFE